MIIYGFNFMHSHLGRNLESEHLYYHRQRSNLASARLRVRLSPRVAMQLCVGAGLEVGLMCGIQVEGVATTLYRQR